MQHIQNEAFSNAQPITLPNVNFALELREYLTYNPKTGALKNKRQRGTARIGELSGCIEKSRAGKLYRRVKFKGKRFYAHVLIMIMLGVFVPSGLEIDHINGDGTDNRAENLRVVTHAENLKNRRRS